ncbi:hypothetical protein HK102_009126, partial [Quaeritorhiza haematococci]
MDANLLGISTGSKAKGGNTSGSGNGRVAGGEGGLNAGVPKPKVDDNSVPTSVANGSSASSYALKVPSFLINGTEEGISKKSDTNHNDREHIALNTTTTNIPATKAKDDEDDLFALLNQATNRRRGRAPGLATSAGELGVSGVAAETVAGTTATSGSEETNKGRRTNLFETPSFLLDEKAKGVGEQAPRSGVGATSGSVKSDGPLVGSAEEGTRGVSGGGSFPWEARSSKQTLPATISNTTPTTTAFSAPKLSWLSSALENTPTTTTTTAAVEKPSNPAPESKPNPSSILPSTSPDRKPTPTDSRRNSGGGARKKAATDTHDDDLDDNDLLDSLG